MASHARDAQVFLQSQLREQAVHITTSNNEHLRACQDVIDRMFHVLPDQLRPQIQRLVEDKVAENLTSLTSSCDIGVSERPTLSLQQKPITRIRRCINRRHMPLITPFGKLLITTETFSTHSGANESQYQSDFTSSSTQIAFLPSKWLQWLGVTRYLHLSMEHRTSSKWLNGLDAPRIIPDDSLIFMYCQQGDVAGIRGLFAEGRASVHDVNSGGLTILHMAALNHHAEACGFLISCNADISARDGLGNRTPLDLVSIWHKSPQNQYATYMHICHDPKHVMIFQPIPTFRTLLDAGAWSGEWDEGLRFTFDNLIMKDSFSHNSMPYYLQDSESPICWLMKQLIPNTYSTPVGFPMFWEFICERSLYLPERGYTAVLEMCPTLAVKTIIDVLIRDPERFFFFRSVSKIANKLHPSHFRMDINFLNLLPEIERRSPTELEVERFVNRLFHLAMRKGQSLQMFNQMIDVWKTDTKDYMKDFAARQATILGGAWSTQKLLTLCHTDLPGPVINQRELYAYGRDCRNCKASITRSDAHKPLWDLHVERIYHGLDPTGPFEEWERVKREKWTEYLQNYKKIGLCVRCYKKMLKASTEESEPHPGLLEIDI